MKILIDINCDNSAFDGEGLLPEIKRLLGTVIGKIMVQLCRKPTLCDEPETADVLMDYNGNTVGHVRIVW